MARHRPAPRHRPIPRRLPRAWSCAGSPPATPTCTAAASTPANASPRSCAASASSTLPQASSAARYHPFLARTATLDDLARYPWVDYHTPAAIPPDDPRPSLSRLLAEFHERTTTHVRDVIRSASASLLLMTTGPYRAWLAVELIERLPGAFLRPLPLAFERFRHRSGFAARRSAEETEALRRLEALVRDTALGRQA